MKRFFSLLSMVLVTHLCFGQSSELTGSEPLDIEKERNRIQAQRVLEEVRFDQNAATCYARFAVTDCLRNVRIERSKVMDNLRRKDVVLNDADRKLKARAQMDRMAEKSAAQLSEESAASRLEAREAQKDREERAKQKAAAALDAKQGPGELRGQPKAPQSGRSTQEISSELEQYNNKLRQAQERKLSRDKSNSEKAGGLSKPLPTEP